MDCCSPSDDELICLNWKSIWKSLRRLCHNRYEQDNKAVHKFTNKCLLVHASPAKAIMNIEMIGDSLRSIQKNNRYLKQRLEDQRENGG